MYIKIQDIWKTTELDSNSKNNIRLYNMLIASNLLKLFQITTALYITSGKEGPLCFSQIKKNLKIQTLI